MPLGFAHMDSFDITRLIALFGALGILAPTIVFILRDHRAAIQNAVIWMALCGVAVLLWTAVWQPSPAPSPRI